jgi:protoporphyrinogen oxidase
MDIGVIGGGLSGLAVAFRLAKLGHRVEVFEQADRPGGLATWQDHGEFDFDRFYHVILPTDTHLISFVQEIGLEERLRWSTSLTGFYVDREVHSVSNALEFLRFKPLSLWGKFRLAMTIIYCSRVNNWRRLEQITVEDWLIRLSGRKTYEKLWKPLLLAKLGENYRRVSAVFIWTYIKRMFSARDTSASREQMGHVEGGYKTVFGELVGQIEQAGGRVHLNTTVSAVRPSDREGLDIATGDATSHFDKVVFTSPVNVLQSVADDSLVSVDGSGANVEYLGVLCMALVTRTPLTPFYVLNVADDRVPFTGVIGMSSIVDTAETGGRYLTYLPKYVLSTDEEMRRPEEELRQEFLDGLRIIYPDLSDEDIVSSRIYRAGKVQPLQVLDFSSLIPSTETNHPDFFVLNTAQFVKNTLNNNEVIRAVNEFMQAYGHKLTGDESGQEVRSE